MKKLTSFLVTCLLTGTAVAQQTDDKPEPKHKKGKGHDSEEKAAPSGDKRTAPAKSEVKKAPDAPKQEKRESRKASQTPAAPAAQKSASEPSARKSTPAKVDKSAARSSDAPKKRGDTNDTTLDNAKKRPKAERDNSNKQAAKSDKTSENAKNSPARRANAAATAQRQPRTPTGNARKPDPQKVKEIRANHANFRAQARPDRVPTVTFTENRRIKNSDSWQGPQYQVFRNYRPERHDERWYRSHYDRIELISGGYYYQHNNYWYPAWGYQPSAEYYAYDGPIYVGQRADPPDRVIADVQAALQDMNYYKGDVDGLLGPLTRDALTDYQSDQGLEPTAAIDEPTLDELGLE